VAISAQYAAWWTKVFPSFVWLRHYNRGWFRHDLVAGITLAAYLLPAALADASLAGLPVQAGLYACLFGGLVFWLFCSSRQTAITVTSAISLLIGSSLGGIAGGDSTRFVSLAACTALLVAAAFFLAWAVRAGAIVKFISETVFTGFKTGVALHIISTQLPKLCGFKGGHGNFWERMGGFIQHAGETNVPSLLLGLIALVLLFAGKRLLPNKPVALIVVIGAIVAASVLQFGNYGIKLLGEVPRGLPLPMLPSVGWSDVEELLPLALACFLLAAVETAAIARMFGEKHGCRFDTNQEFLALAGANLASGLGHGLAISGGMSQSLVNESAGARTPLSGLFAAGLLLLVALFFSDTLRNLPQPVLAAIILLAVTGLFKFAELRRLWRMHRGEFLVAIMALLGVLWAGLLKGVLIGAVISLVMLIRRVSTPHIAFLGRIPGTRRYSDLSRHETNEPIPNILAFRVEAGIVYFNVEHISETVLSRIDAISPKPRFVVCDLSTSANIDMAGAQLFLGLYHELENRGVTFRIVEARAKVRDILRLEGVEDKVGRIDRFTTLADAIDNLRGEQSTASLPEIVAT
jgi:sulfate permease, SulP family